MNKRSGKAYCLEDRYLPRSAAFDESEALKCVLKVRVCVRALSLLQMPNLNGHTETQVGEYRAISRFDPRRWFAESTRGM